MSHVLVNDVRQLRKQLSERARLDRVLRRYLDDMRALEARELVSRVPAALLYAMEAA